MDQQRTLHPTTLMSFAPILILTVTLDTEKDAIEKALPTLNAQKQPKTPADDAWGFSLGTFHAQQEMD